MHKGSDAATLMTRATGAVPLSVIRPLTVLSPGSGGGASAGALPCGASPGGALSPCCPEPHAAMTTASAHRAAPAWIRNDINLSLSSTYFRSSPVLSSRDPAMRRGKNALPAGDSWLTFIFPAALRTSPTRSPPALFVSFAVAPPRAVTATNTGELRCSYPAPSHPATWRPSHPTQGASIGLPSGPNGIGTRFRMAGIDLR